MTTASWCVLLALVTSYACCALGRMRARVQGVPGDDRVPCVLSAAFPVHPSWDAKRNAFQALALFAAAVLIAQQAGAPQAWVDVLALSWIFVRIAHMGFHLAERPSLRRLAQVASIGCAVAIFAGSALAGHSHAAKPTTSRVMRSSAGLRD